MSSRLRRFDHRAFVDRLKAGPCADCDRAFPPCAMDFDHVRGRKDADVSRLYLYAKETILAEVAKCDLVCACCHRIRTNRRELDARVDAALDADVDSELEVSRCPSS